MQLYGKRSIRARIIWPVIGILLICFMALGSTLIQLKGGLQRDLVLNEYVSYYEELLEIVHADQMQLMEAALKGVSHSTELESQISSRNTVALNKVAQALGQNFSLIGLSAVVITSPLNEVLGYYRSDEAKYRFSPSQVPLSALQSSDGVINYVVAVPVIRNGEQVGSIYGVLPFGDVLSDLQKKTSSDAIYVYRSAGDTYAGTMAQDEYEVDAKHVQAALAGKVAYELLDNGKQLVVLYPIQDDWDYVVGFTKIVFDISIYADIFAQATKSVLLTFAGTIVILVLALRFILALILRPVKEVLSVSGQLSQIGRASCRERV